MSQITEQDWNDWNQFLLSIQEFVESLETVPSYRLLDTDDIDGLMDNLTDVGAAAAHFGDEETDCKCLLVCDDQPLSEYARSIGTNCVNTQAVLIELKRTGIITGDEYSKFIEQLVELNYRFVQVRGEDIVRRLEAAGYSTTPGIRAMFKTLEGPECSEDAGVAVATDIMIGIVGKSLAGQAELILSMIVAVLKRGREPVRVLTRFRDVLDSRLVMFPFARVRLLESLNLHIETCTTMNLKGL